MIRIISPLLIILFCFTAKADDAFVADTTGILNDFKVTNENEKKVCTFYLDSTSNNKGYTLKIEANEKFSLFINKNIHSNSKSVELKIDSLFNALELSVISFSLYGDTEINFEIIEKPAIKENSVSPVRLSEAFDFSLNNFIIFSIFCLLFLVAILKTKYGKTYKDFFLIQRILAAKDKEEEIFKYRFFSNQVLLFALMFSLIVSSLLIINYNLGYYQSSNILLFRSAPFLWLVLKWLGLSIIIYVSVIVKYILIASFTGIFKIKSYRSNHFLNYLRFSSLFFGIVLLLQCLVYFGGNSYFLFNNILNIGIFIMIARSMVIFVKLINYFGNRVLHLFSYLCATELIPLIFIVFLTRMLLSI